MQIDIFNQQLFYDMQYFFPAKMQLIHPDCSDTENLWKLSYCLVCIQEMIT